MDKPVSFPLLRFSMPYRPKSLESPWSWRQLARFFNSPTTTSIPLEMTILPYILPGINQHFFEGPPEYSIFQFHMSSCSVQTKLPIQVDEERSHLQRDAEALPSYHQRPLTKCSQVLPLCRWFWLCSQGLFISYYDERRIQKKENIKIILYHFHPFQMSSPSGSGQRKGDLPVLLDWDFASPKPEHLQIGLVASPYILAVRWDVVLKSQFPGSKNDSMALKQIIIKDEIDGVRNAVHRHFPANKKRKRW